MAAWKLLATIAGGLALASPMAYWLGGGEFPRLGYQPPTLTSGWTGAVSAEAKERGVELGQPDPFKEFIGYRDGTPINVYRGEWSATRDGHPLAVSVEAETRNGKWRVTRWHER